LKSFITGMMSGMARCDIYGCMNYNVCYYCFALRCVIRWIFEKSHISLYIFCYMYYDSC